MILPSGVNKATVLKAAFLEKGWLPERTVAIGDAENDHAFLKFCGWAVAVNNAVVGQFEFLGVRGRMGNSPDIPPAKNV